MRRSVPTFPGSETFQSASTTSRVADGQVGAAVDADDARRVSERRDLGEQLRQDVLTGDEQLDGLDARPGGRLDEVLALDREEARLVAMLPRREKLPDEPELLVLTRFDQAASADPERSLRALGDGGERLRVAHRDVRERLAVELDPGLLHALHEAVVREAVLARGSVDADDPERPERPLLRLAVAVGVDERVLDLLLREAVARLLAPVVALRLLEDLGALLARVDGTLDPGHVNRLSGAS